MLALGALVATIVTPSRAEDPPAVTVTVTHTATVTRTATYRGRTATSWASAYRRRTRQLQAAQGRTRALRRTLLARPSVVEAINLAAAVYGNGSTLWALARCESTLNPHARNPSSSTGLFQILYPSTWRTTPFSGFDVYSAYANALAAGYMVAHGRRGEWVC